MRFQQQELQQFPVLLLLLKRDLGHPDFQHLVKITEGHGDVVGASTYVSEGQVKQADHYKHELFNG